MSQSRVGSHPNGPCGRPPFGELSGGNWMASGPDACALRAPTFVGTWPSGSPLQPNNYSASAGLLRRGAAPEGPFGDP